MEHEQEPISPNESQQDTQPVYTPRPKWQVWAARIGLVLFVLLVILYYINIARGGR